MMGSTKHPRITNYMKKLLDEYEQIRGKSCLERPFWDIVVITASDTAQQEAFQLQVDEKILHHEVPSDLSIHVITDPPGIRIGNGGSTLTCLEFLHKEYKEKLFDLKILLIHAGGWSQRMPSATVLGKIFSILPHGDPPFQMLDLKLALYWPFVERIQPGIFLVCADDFLVFDLGDKKEWKIPGQGFTALAHPAPLEVGLSHGVYVLADADTLDTSEPVKLCECLKVLQKPTESRMKSEGALLNGNSFTFGDGISLDGNVVYTDSCFYFGIDVMRKLLKFKQSVQDLSCEIDAYGDFLQAVGKNASNEYIHLTFNVSQPTPNLLDMRQKVFEALNGSNIHVLTMNSSKFIHIGTTRELLYHFCHDDEFQQQLNLGKNIFNSWTKVVEEKMNVSQNDGNESERKMKDYQGLSENACLIHCSLDQNSVIGCDCFLEFCHFEKPVTLSNFCIMSNCQITEQDSKLERIFVPSHIFLHTIPIKYDGSGRVDVEYVTIFFHIEDNLKKSASLKDVGSLPFLDSNIDFFLNRQGINIQDVLPASKSFMEIEEGEKDTSKVNQHINSSLDKVSLWNLKLYSAHPSMTSSLEETLTILKCSEELRKKPKCSHKLFSMADLLKVKNVSKMLKFRQNLYEKIVEHRKE